MLVATAGSILLAVAAIFGLTAVASHRLRANYEAEKAELLARARAMQPTQARRRSLDDLPALLQRYLRASQQEGAVGLRTAMLTQRGRLRAAPDKPWMPFQAEQVYTFEPAGFVWFAQASFAPFVPMLARDKYQNGKGHMRVHLFGAIRVADARGHEMDLGASLRYWGEIMAFPESVRSARVRWEAIDTGNARMTVEQDSLRMAAVVEFGADGLLNAIHADRYRDVNGVGVLTAWSGRFRDWKQLDGRLFPTAWESIWHLPEGDFHAVEMNILSLRTE